MTKKEIKKNNSLVISAVFVFTLSIYDPVEPLNICVKLHAYFFFCVYFLF